MLEKNMNLQGKLVNVIVQVFDKDASTAIENYYEQTWVKRLLENSAKYGFDNVDEYLDYIEQSAVLSNNLEIVGAKDDFCM